MCAFLVLLSLLSVIGCVKQTVAAVHSLVTRLTGKPERTAVSLRETKQTSKVLRHAQRAVMLTGRDSEGTLMYCS